MSTSSIAAMITADDPFAGLEDQAASRPADVRAHFLERARRGYGELHRDWIQRPRGSSGPRASALARFVTDRRETALEALLLLHALQPVLQLGQPLAMDVWAAMLTRQTPVSDTTASKAFHALEQMNLVRRRREGRRSLIEPLAEDGSGADWVRPGTRGDKIGQGYFILPFSYWLDGYSASLHLPGKAMLLILLADTQAKQTSVIPIERAQEWYGISERTAERGYRELDRAGLLRVHRQQLSNPEVKGGQYHVYHRALAAPFSTFARQQLQQAAKTAGEARRRAADTDGGQGGDEKNGNPTPAART